MRLAASSLLLLALLCAIPARAADDWQELRSVEGGFSVMMPGKPKLTVDPPDAAGITAHSYLVDLGQVAYMVAYSDYPAGRLSKVPAERVLEDARDNLIKDRNVSLRIDRPISLADHPGREVIFEAADGFTQMIRLYVVKDRLYQTISGGPKGHEQTKGALRFHDSFRFLAKKSK